MRFARWIPLAIIAVLVLMTLAGIVWTWLEDDRVGVGTFALALATFILAVVSFYEMQESRKRAQEDRRAAFRPLLIPTEEMGPWTDPDTARYWNSSQCMNTIRNVGTGVATNVKGVILPPTEPAPSTDLVFSASVFRPLAADESMSVLFEKGAILVFRGNQIANVPLFATASSHHMLRLTLTYWDILGLKHASIFDLTKDGV
jgi:hypothetical protein